MVSLYGNRTAAMTLQNKENNDDEYVCLAFLLFFYSLKKRKNYKSKCQLTRIPGKSRCVCIHHYHPNEMWNINFSAVQMKSKDKSCKLTVIFKVRGVCAYASIILVLGKEGKDRDNNLEAMHLDNL